MVVMARARLPIFWRELEAMADAVHCNVFSLLKATNYVQPSVKTADKSGLPDFEALAASAAASNRAVILDSPYAVKVKSAGRWNRACCLSASPL